MKFELHPNLQTKQFLIDLPLCRVLLEDDVNYPWVFLIPRRNQVSLISDLEKVDQLQLLEELNLSQKIFNDLFRPSQINVAAIGNKTPQLHIHIIGRYVTDPAWPNTVWDHPLRTPYLPEKKKEVIAKLQSAFKLSLKQS